MRRINPTFSSDIANAVSLDGVLLSMQLVQSSYSDSPEDLDKGTLMDRGGVRGWTSGSRLEPVSLVVAE